MASPTEWYLGLPPFTQCYLTVVVATAALVSFGLMDPSGIALIWGKMWNEWQYWRLLSPFLYFGPFRPDFLLSLAVL